MANERFFKISELKIIITIFASSTTGIFFDLYDMERTNYFEGYVEPPPQSNERNALKMESYKWPNGVVPFIFDTNYSDDEQSVVLHAMQVFFENTCVKFTPKTDDDVEHIRFTKSRVCGSNIGYRAGRKEPLDVTYSQYCLTVPGAVQHELFHVLGLLHEQCRPDRDDHITVVWENIEPRMELFVYENVWMHAFGLEFSKMSTFRKCWTTAAE